MEIDEEPTTHEERMEDYARRQAKAAETTLLVIEVALFLAVVAAVIWLVAVLGR